MWTVRNGEFQSKSKASRVCKDCYFCASWCVCHGESFWLSGLCVGMWSGYLLQWGAYTFSLTLDDTVNVSLYSFCQCISFLRLLLRLDFLVFACCLMLSLILATNLREAISRWAVLVKGLDVSLLSFPRPSCCLFLYLRLLRVIRKMFTILSFIITDGFL